MIISDPNYQWSYIQPSNPLLPYQGEYDFPKSREESLGHWGKWAIIDERDFLDELSIELDSYVEERYICNVKYLRRPPAWLEFDQPFMCVFCDDREKKAIWKILAKLGVTQKLWVYERETTALWSPGGEFFEKMVAHRKLNPEEREKVAEKFQKWNEEYLSHLFEGSEEEQGIWNYEQFLLKQDKGKMIR